MVIKIHSISGTHGHNAISYAMKKDKSEVKPEFLAANFIPNDDILGIPVDPTSVWMSMKLRQEHSGHHVKDGFFRIEICPSAEESKGWGRKDFKKCLDDAIRHLDQTDFVTRAGKVIGHHTDLANTQWIATIHRDTDNLHIHLIANRITENNELQDANKCENRGFLAANKLAVERGWTMAKDKLAERKEQIHADAIAVLRNMKHFNIQEYFNRMRAMGWEINERYDSSHVCRGYSIGSKLYKVDGTLSSTVMYKASDLGHGRDLMASKLANTWDKLHGEGIKQETKAADMENSFYYPFSGVPTITLKTEQQLNPQWTCSEHTSKENWLEDGISVRIPDKVFSMLDSQIEPLDEMDYYNAADEIPSRKNILAVAVFEFLADTYVQVPSGGGGGGSSKNDLRWDGKTAEDFQRMAEAAAKRAVRKCTAGLRKRRKGMHL